MTASVREARLSIVRAADEDGAILIPGEAIDAACVPDEDLFDAQPLHEAFREAHCALHRLHAKSSAVMAHNDHMMATRGLTSGLSSERDESLDLSCF